MSIINLYTVISVKRGSSMFKSNEDDFILGVVNHLGEVTTKRLTHKFVLSKIDRAAIDPIRITEEDINNILLRFEMSYDDWEGKPKSYKDYFFPKQASIKHDEIIDEIDDRTQLSMGEIRRLNELKKK